ncbi:MAG: hypothetical protein WCG98_06735 [bacterium]
MITSRDDIQRAPKFCVTNKFIKAFYKQGIYDKEKIAQSSEYKQATEKHQERIASDKKACIALFTAVAENLRNFGEFERNL